MEGVNNKTLLAWSDYEVKEARRVLHSAEVRNRILEGCVKAYLKKLGVPVIAYSTATSLEELLVMVSNKKAFLKRHGYSEEELEP